MCGEVVCGEVVCEQVVCEEVVCGGGGGGGGGGRRAGGGGSAEPKTRTPHKDVGNNLLLLDGVCHVGWHPKLMLSGGAERAAKLEV